MEISFDFRGRNLKFFAEEVSDGNGKKVIINLLEDGSNINKEEINLSSLNFCCPHCAERLFVDIDKLDVRINNVLSNKNLIIINMTDACSEERLQQICIGIDIIEIL